MPFQPENFYHVYNRGNNKQKIFFSDANYAFFLKKIEVEISPCCDIVAYCLMPNHYHIMIYFAEQHVNFRPFINMQNLERKIGTLQSSYTRAINIQENRTGSLFQQKYKVVDISDVVQAMTCFDYIHLNPVKAGLVEKMDRWNYSSFQEYRGLRAGICNQEVAYKYLGIARERGSSQ